MYKKIVIPLVIFLALAALVFLTQGAPENKENPEPYVSVSSAELEAMLEDKDFLFVDVHTPEQEHIPETDFMVPHNQVEKIASALDNKKDAKVVLYCRSGSMSKIAAQELAGMGYTNVYELIGGMHDWVSQGRETTPVGSVTKM